MDEILSEMRMELVRIMKCFSLNGILLTQQTNKKSGVALSKPPALVVLNASLAHLVSDALTTASLPLGFPEGLTEFTLRTSCSLDRTGLPRGFALLNVFGNSPTCQFTRPIDFDQLFDRESIAVHFQRFLPIESGRNRPDVHLESNHLSDEPVRLGFGLCGLGHSGPLTAIVDLGPLAVNRGLIGRVGQRRVAGFE
jgi:hypothetical protein